MADNLDLNALRTAIKQQQRVGGAETAANGVEVVVDQGTIRQFRQGQAPTRVSKIHPGVFA